MSRSDDKSLIALENTDVQRSIDPDVVEFALVLSRTIHSLQQRPNEMRQALYELARHNCNQQLKGRHGKEFRIARSTLETAIEKVEWFHSEHGEAGEFLHKLSSPLKHAERGSAIKNVTVEALPAAPVQFDGPQSALKPPASMAIRLVAVLCALTTAAIALQALRSFGTNADSKKAQVSIETPAAVDTTQPMQASDQSARKPQPLLPSHFGAFAVAEGRLFELRPLRGAYDARVAISAVLRNGSEQSCRTVN